MTENSGFAAYALWNALKLHFTSESYDYFKYNGKTNVSKQTFTTNKSKYQFYKLSRKYDLNELKNFYVANFIQGKGDWVGELLQDGDENYTKWQKTQQSLTYTFNRDIIGLFESSGNCLYVDNGNHPVLLREVMQGVVSLETLCIMDDIMNFLPMWSKKIEDDIIWPDWEMKILKYKPFLNYDKVKFKAILKEKIKEYA
jgi:hypothetical protein